MSPVHAMCRSFISLSLLLRHTSGASWFGFEDSAAKRDDGSPQRKAQVRAFFRDMDEVNEGVPMLAKMAKMEEQAAAAGQRGSSEEQLTKSADSLSSTGSHASTTEQKILSKASDMLKQRHEKLRTQGVALPDHQQQKRGLFCAHENTAAWKKRMFESEDVYDEKQAEKFLGATLEGGLQADLYPHVDFFHLVHAKAFNWQGLAWKMPKIAFKIRHQPGSKLSISSATSSPGTSSPGTTAAADVCQFERAPSAAPVYEYFSGVQMYHLKMSTKVEVEFFVENADSLQKMEDAAWNLYNREWGGFDYTPAQSASEDRREQQQQNADSFFAPNLVDDDDDERPAVTSTAGRTPTERGLLHFFHEAAKHFLPRVDEDSLDLMRRASDAELERSLLDGFSSATRQFASALAKDNKATPNAGLSIAKFDIRFTALTPFPYNSWFDPQARPVPRVEFDEIDMSPVLFARDMRSALSFNLLLAAHNLIEQQVAAFVAQRLDNAAVEEPNPMNDHSSSHWGTGFVLKMKDVDGSDNGCTGGSSTSRAMMQTPCDPYADSSSGSHYYLSRLHCPLPCCGSRRGPQLEPLPIATIKV
ncbi:unnamed protein product [Amoebophrya sp. A120]|nr:unnamed protein product [Amoebophrya sp. A120]|eukprot:GSA120T00024008001.1